MTRSLFAPRSWLPLAAIALALSGIAAACGGAGSTEVAAGGDDASMGGGGQDGATVTFDGSGIDSGPAPVFDSGTGHTDGGEGGATCSGATTCAQAGANCGPIGDGCGGTLQCGTCGAGQTCGGGGTASVCGAPACTPNTCASLGINCGATGDGCGNSLMCGTCEAGTCGGGGMSNVCGTGTVCTPTSCAQQHVSCGPSGDGCGNTLDCGTCPSGQTCGGGGTSGACGAPVCVPKTCAGLGLNCGPAADGCGNIIQCGTCNAPETCGGTMANVCGIPPTCTNLCLQQTTCPNSGTTSITGTVYAPNGIDPLYDALVYVPNAPVTPFPAGVSCDTCGAAASGSPLVSAITAVNGTFTITNMPVGTNIPLVIQLGRWRRQIVIPNVPSCVSTPVATTLTHMPSVQTATDNIPLMGFVTGSVDALECVLRKIGIADSQFSDPSGTGRIRFYKGAGSTGSKYSNNTPSETSLWGTQAEINAYDMVYFACQGGEYDRTTAQQQIVINYANAGGRIFATHYSYVWFFNDAPFSSTAAWDADQTPNFSNDPETANVNTTFPKGLAMAQWLQVVGASTTLGQIQLATLRNDFNSVVAPSEMWLSITDPNYSAPVPMHYTFNTPVNAAPANQCGRALYSDFHVEDATTGGTTFPHECTSTTMTPQEKMLEFMIFDLSSCVTPDVPVCTPATCAGQNIGCGAAGDGCGNIIQCGTCPAGETCGGGGTPSQCGAPNCPAKTCLQQGIQCGPAGDGCGNELQCGTCPTGQTCGGGGMSGVCGTEACTPKTCAQQGITCGPAGDGCGNLLQCGTCASGMTCGGGGTSGMCGTPPCTAKTCAQLNANCGAVANGCGGTLQCGTCTSPQTCGGSGTANVCGSNAPP